MWQGVSHSAEARNEPKVEYPRKKLAGGLARRLLGKGSPHLRCHGLVVSRRKLRKSRTRRGGVKNRRRPFVTRNPDESSQLGRVAFATNADCPSGALCFPMGLFKRGKPITIHKRGRVVSAYSAMHFQGIAPCPVDCGIPTRNVLGNGVHDGPPSVAFSRFSSCGVEQKASGLLLHGEKPGRCRPAAQDPVFDEIPHENTSRADHAGGFANG